MPIFALMELVAIFLAILFILNQLLIPAVRGTLLFPMFRKEHTLQSVILEQRQKAVEQSLERAIAENEVGLNSSASTEDSNVVTPKEIV
jgi:hypothetical protein